MRQQVARDLFKQESVKRNIGVHGINHPVAVSPRFAEQKVFVQPVGIGIATQIQPVPSPALPELRRVQQLINSAFPGIFGIIIQKGRHLFRCRRQPDQLKIHSPNQRATIGVFRWRQVRRFKLCQYEGVNWRSRPVHCFDGRTILRFRRQRSKGPVVTPGNRIGRISPLDVCGQHLVARIWCSDRDPSLQCRDRFFWQSLVRRHLQIRICVSDGRNQKTRIDIAGNNGRTFVTTHGPTRHAVQQQTAFTLLRT